MHRTLRSGLSTVSLRQKTFTLRWRGRVNLEHPRLADGDGVRLAEPDMAQNLPMNMQASGPTSVSEARIYISHVVDRRVTMSPTTTYIHEGSCTASAPRRPRSDVCSMDRSVEMLHRFLLRRSRGKQRIAATACACRQRGTADCSDGTAAGQDEENGCAWMALL
jgi:hypothetical protein